MFVENQHHNNNILLASSLILNTIATIEKSNITFFLGVVVSLLAIANYILEIRKKIKGGKRNTKG